jgi:hypothetical protein
LHPSEPLTHDRHFSKEAVRPAAGFAWIEQAKGKLKRFKRVAMRCDKTAEGSAAFVSVACGLILVKSVHRA